MKHRLGLIEKSHCYTLPLIAMGFVVVPVLFVLLVVVDSFRQVTTTSHARLTLGTDRAAR
jgi:hypothetical protein